ncbi:MAG: hypothetical protein OEZ22_06630 [Spirochaetia bacterium]|nr:hypothetical protein [Spirochaetia bacterium]
MEKNDKVYELFERSLENRKREISEMKLSAAGPYIWQPLLACESLNYEKTKKDEITCIKTSFKFVPKLKSEKLNSFYNDTNFIKYNEKTPKPCEICHRRQKDQFIAWSFSANEPAKSQVFTQIIQNKLYFQIHLATAAVVLLYVLIKYLYRYMSSSSLTAFTLIFSGNEKKLFEKIKLKEKSFLYAEKSDNYFRGYIARGSLVRWLKKTFTASLDFSERELSLIRGAAVQIPAKGKASFPLEGLRVTHTIALRTPSGYLMIEEGLLKKLVAKEKIKVEKRKGIWKIKDKQTIFYLLYLSDKNKMPLIRNEVKKESDKPLEENVSV